MSLKLSIVICTHRRFSLLENAIESLMDQTAVKDVFEVIVVDNDVKANDKVSSLVKKASAKINISYIHEPKLGLSNARNTGGKVAKSDYVGYIDDDAKASTNFVAKAIEIIENKHPDSFGGPYYPYYLNEKPNWFKDIYQSGIPANEDRYLRSNEFLKGTNMIYKKTLLEKLNWFDEKYGMTGDKIGYGEETALQIKAHRSDPELKVWYGTGLIVEHLVTEDKFKLWDKMKRSYNIGQSQSDLWLTESELSTARKKAPLTLLRTFFNFSFKALPGILFHDKKKYPNWKNYTYEVVSGYFASMGQEWQHTKDLIFKK